MQSLAAADELTRTFQELVTAQVWARAWTGSALDDRTRALVTLGILAGLGRFDEVEVYAKGALRSGVTVDDIRDVLVHVTAYCGAPAGRQAFAMDGSNQVASTWDVPDMEAFQAAQRSFSPELAAAERAGMIPPIGHGLVLLRTGRVEPNVDGEPITSDHCRRPGLASRRVTSAGRF
jgi:alkylhydroperoxidase/carboxymuconolactone decarboxylase family protein YurZ